MKINHVKGYCQVGETCGIYAFINAMIDFRKCERESVNCFAEKLWEKAIDSNYKGNFKDMSPDILNYSLIGEFASSQNLVDFLNKNKDFINKELSVLSDRKFNKAKIINNDGVDNLSPGTYLIVIRTQCEVCHCICYKKYIDKGVIINSANSPRSQEKRAMRLATCKKKTIKSSDDLRILIYNAQNIFKVNLKPTKRFCLCSKLFNKLKDKKYLKGWPDEARRNFCKIRNLSDCCYSYKKYNKQPFLPIKIF